MTTLPKCTNASHAVLVADDKPWEVWLVELDGERMNARFAGIDRAFEEKDWYVARGYRAHVRVTKDRP